MKLRKYVSYITLVAMFAMAGFGSFYILTGDNLLTGQKREGRSGNVLSEHDNKESLGKVAIENKAEEKPEYTEERLLFDQVMSKTKDATSLQLEATSGGEAAVFYRFGVEKNKSYLAVFASGITSEDLTLKAWLLDSEGKDKEIGEIKLVDSTDVYKLALETDADLSKYTTAVVTATKKGEDSEKYNEANVVYSADFDFSEELKMEDTAEDSQPEETTPQEETAE